MVDKAERIDDPNTRFIHVGNLEGHNDWVTSIVTGHSTKENEESPVLLSGSRDRTLLIWKLTGGDEEVDETAANRLYGVPLKALTGHNHFISDVALSQDNYFAITSSWDSTLRLWDLRAGKASKIFNGHTREVHSVTFSSDHRQIISAGADRKYRLWNTMADCKLVNEVNNHSDWVSSVRYSPVPKNPYFVTTGWDGRLKVWNSNFVLRESFKAHSEHINALAIAPLGGYFATGGKENNVKIWDLQELKEPYIKFNTGASVNKIAFNPVRQWAAAGCDNGVHIFDLQTESEEAMARLVVERPKKKKESKLRSDGYACTAVAWSSSGRKLYAAFTDNVIRVYDVNIEENKA
jgi:guanine nucleotide-binding protein subunit beta-2-like 1 protein